MKTVTLSIRSIVWFVTGAVLATSVTLMFAHAWSVDAAPGDTDSTFVPIAPCRLADTRPAPARIGPSGTLAADDTTTFQATGSNGECVLPSDAVGLSLNVTALGATTVGNFLTVWPDGERPLAASLNPAPGEPPTPNAVTTPLSATGSFDVYNFVGTVNVVIDVVGYYTKASLQELAQRLAAVEASAATNAAGLATNAAAIAGTNASVAALDAAQPFSASSEPISNVTAQSSPTQIVSVTVTAPVAGQVTAAASGNMSENVDGHRVGCGLNESVSAVPPTDFAWWQASPGAAYSHLSSVRVFDITAGQTATYSLICQNLNGASSTIEAPRVVAVFTPAP